MSNKFLSTIIGITLIIQTGFSMTINNTISYYPIYNSIGATTPNYINSNNITNQTYNMNLNTTNYIPYNIIQSSNTCYIDQNIGAN